MKSVITVNRATRVASLVITLDGGEPNQPFKIDWGDASGIQVLASGAHAGPTTHTYAKTGQYEVRVQGNDIHTWEKISVGDTLRAYDPQKVEENQFAASQANERAKAAQIMGQVKSGLIG